MSSASAGLPKSHTPRARAISMPTGIIEAAISPATRVFHGGLGMIAANMRTSDPTQVNIGWSDPSGDPRQCQMIPMSSEVRTRYTNPRSSRKRGDRREARL